METTILEDSLHGDQLDMDVNWIRPEGWKNEAGDGLIIPTLPGGIWDDKMEPAKNILTRSWPVDWQNDHPLAAEVRVRIQPQCWGEQAGLVLYNSDKDWIKLVVEGSKDNTARIVLAQRTPTKAAEIIAKQELPSSHDQVGEAGGVRLRLEISSDRTEIAGLVNCRYCIRLVARISHTQAPRQVGLMAHGSESEDKHGFAFFDDFKLMQIAPDRVQFAGTQAVGTFSPPPPPYSVLDAVSPSNTDTTRAFISLSNIAQGLSPNEFVPARSNMMISPDLSPEDRAQIASMLESVSGALVLKKSPEPNQSAAPIVSANRLAKPPTTLPPFLPVSPVTPLPLTSNLFSNDAPTQAFAHFAGKSFLSPRYIGTPQSWTPRTQASPVNRGEMGSERASEPISPRSNKSLVKTAKTDDTHHHTSDALGFHTPAQHLRDSMQTHENIDVVDFSRNNIEKEEVETTVAPELIRAWKKMTNLVLMPEMAESAKQRKGGREEDLDSTSSFLQAASPSPVQDLVSTVEMSRIDTDNFAEEHSAFFADRMRDDAQPIAEVAKAGIDQSTATDDGLDWLEQQRQREKKEIQKRCKKEIKELHAFFEQWFLSSEGEGPEDLSRFEDVTSEKDFYIITANGDMMDFDKLRGLLQDAHGCLSASKVPLDSDTERENSSTHSSRFAEKIEEVKLLKVMPAKDAKYYLCKYKETQIVDGVDKARICTVLFEECEKCQNKLRWLHVHETFHPAAE